MKHIPLLLLTLFTVGAAAQCATCTPDAACVSPDGFPALCPDVLPNGTAGTPYEQFITFYLPPTITDPQSGLVVNLNSVTVTSISGLPFGMEFTLGDPDGTFEPGNGQNLGCATLCGTPVLPGNYTITINVNAAVTVSGFSLNQPQSFDYPITIDPGAGSTGSFTYEQSAACDLLTTTLQATIEAPAPAITTYAWDLGNGLTSTDSSVQATYDTPGSYMVHLTTTVSGYQLNAVQATSLNSNWGNDEDIFGSADPFFQLIDADGNVAYTSSIVDNNNAPSWSGLAISLDNPPYQISFTDDDPISADDALGTAALSIASGNTTFNAGNGTVGNISCTLVHITSITDSLAMNVFPSSSLSISVTGNTLSAQPADLASYTWYLNGAELPDNTLSSIVASTGGVYSVVGVNEYGCTTNEASATYCPAVLVQYDGVAQELSVDQNFASYQWYFNGVALQGANLFYLIAPQQGVYMVEVTTTYGCTIQSAPYVINAVEEIEVTKSISVFPNPFNDFISLQRDALPSSTEVWTLYGIDGKMMMRGQWLRGETNLRIATDVLPAGMYILECAGEQHKLIRR